MAEKKADAKAPETQKAPEAALTDTPEFKAAVNAAVDAAMQKLAGELAAARKVAGTEEAPEIADDQHWIRQLALAIGEISDQGTHRKRVAPEILAKRAAARERMFKLIVEAKARGDMPEYRLIAEVYFNETKLPPFTNDPVTKRPVPTEIGWDGPPNEVTLPINDVARGIYAAFMESIGGNSDMTNWSPKGGVAVKTGGAGPAWVTPNGLYVKGATSAQRRTVGALPDSNAPAPEFSNSLVAKRANDPRAEFVHVLGTVAPPARQNAAGQT